MDFVRVAAIGSVDDGKSTLMGRLLLATGSISDDQVEALRRVSSKINLAFVTDGLRAERDMAITIDVAHRHFSTAHRRFLILDCPGHREYTQNLVTGVTNSDIALLIIDAARGVTEQTQHHLAIATHFGAQTLIVCVNKMDLVGFESRIFAEIAYKIRSLTPSQRQVDSYFLPISGLNSENVTSVSSKMPWYSGPHLLELLETVHCSDRGSLAPARFPVQLILNDSSPTPAIAGRLESGELRVGDQVVIFPSGASAQIRSIRVGKIEQQSLHAPHSGTLTLSDTLRPQRGDVICKAESYPIRRLSLELSVVWFADEPLTAGQKLAFRFTTHTVPCTVVRIHADPTEAIARNEMGRVTVQLDEALYVDTQSSNRSTGRAILINEKTNATVAACLIESSH